MLSTQVFNFRRTIRTGFCLVVTTCLLVTETESAELPADTVQAIDAAVGDAIAGGKIPGCVVCIGRRDEIVFQRAYGQRQIKPEPEAMTTDTIFDLASLTKPVATATGVLLLVEQGKIELDSTVARYLPDFAANGKEQIKVRHLLTHQSGLIADNALVDYADGPETARARLLALKPTHAPGERFVYSDVGFLILGILVEAVGGKPLDEFVVQEICLPLKMNETQYRPPASLTSRIAPTAFEEGHWLRGRVHDPRAVRLGGVAGHAGLFSTAADLSLFAQRLLAAECGEPGILKRETIGAMLTPETIATGKQKEGEPVLARRGLGWDMRSPYSVNRPPSLGDRAIGHTGFTGTSIWIDPDQDLFIILLSSRLHPDGKGLSNPLAAKVGELAAQALKKTIAN